MLKMMGHSATVPGVILAEDVPAALSHLTAAIDAEKAAPPIEDKDVDESAVGMAHRHSLRFLLPQPGANPT